MRWSQYFLQWVEDKEVEKTRATFHWKHRNIPELAEHMNGEHEAVDSNPDYFFSKPEHFVCTFFMLALHYCYLAFQICFEAGSYQNQMHIIIELEYIHCKWIVCSSQRVKSSGIERKQEIIPVKTMWTNSG